MDLSIVLPVYNEQHNIAALYERVTSSAVLISSEYELLFVDDGSNDRSLDLLKELAATDGHIRYISLSRNYGHQLAVTAGLEHCRGETVVIIDADLQDPPELIPELHAKLEQGFDVVYAKRRTRTGDGLIKRATAAIYYRFLDRISDVYIPIDTGDFRILRRRVVNVLKRMPEQQKYLRGQIAWAGFKQTHLDYDRHERNAGDSGYSYGKMLGFALDGITSFSNFPLRFATLLGFVISGLSFLLIVWAVVAKFVSPTYQAGWSSIMISILFIGGVQLICLGIIGEYIGRINQNVRNRPLYLIDESNFDGHDVADSVPRPGLHEDR